MVKGFPAGGPLLAGEYSLGIMNTSGPCWRLLCTATPIAGTTPWADIAELTVLGMRIVCQATQCYRGTRSVCRCAVRVQGLGKGVQKDTGRLAHGFISQKIIARLVLLAILMTCCFLILDPPPTLY